MSFNRASEEMTNSGLSEIVCGGGEVESFRLLFPDVECDKA